METMDEMILQISICDETGMLIASWDDPTGAGGLTTQADNLGELEANIREAVGVHFDSQMPSRIRLHFAMDPVLAAA